MPTQDVNEKEELQDPDAPLFHDPGQRSYGSQRMGDERKDFLIRSKPSKSLAHR